MVPPGEAVVRRLLQVAGVVQGVGFRPFAYRLALQHGLTGLIANTSGGVTIEVQGPPDAVDDFIERLPKDAPPLARVAEVAVRPLPARPESAFEIAESPLGCPAPIPPDVATCEACLAEMRDPGDRRHRYPFINCTDCGPRFTIVHATPYDRARTSMAAFAMCRRCRAEYDDPRSRRFHAQPNACPDCGPQLELWGPEGRLLSGGDVVRECGIALKAGAIVAVKGLGGFHLAVDATNAFAVARLRDRKHRAEKPLAVMAAGLPEARRLVRVDEEARRALVSPARPIVLLPWLLPSPVADVVAPRQQLLGVLLPYTPVHHLLMAEGFVALVLTSGNLTDEPVAVSNLDALDRLRCIADLFLVNDREILQRCDDSVVRVDGGTPVMVRRSRGFAPLALVLPVEVPPVLAVGAELKNTVCLARGREAVLSQHVGDLQSTEACRFFEEAVAWTERLLDVSPPVVAHDMHPDAFGTRWAERSGRRTVAVQHHHAHVASCMAENGLHGDVIGIALDGAGHGTDGTTWGGEVLVAGYARFQRAAHLAPVAMPGGDAAAREPWRMALSHLARTRGRALLDLPIPFCRALDHARAGVLLAMIDKGVNAPLTSSCGRLFDAVAALAGVRQRTSYEGQAAVELETAVDHGAHGEYPFDVVPSGAVLVLDPRPLFEALVRDIAHGEGAGAISRRFHHGLASALAEVCGRVRESSGLERVCLSGGCFHNAVLRAALSERLRTRGFVVFTQSQVPCGDGGLSLGQALVAAHRTETN